MTLALIALNVAAFLFWEPTFASGPAGEQRQEIFFFCQAEIPWEVTHQTTLGDGGAAAREALREAGFQAAAEDQQVLAQRCAHKSWLLSIFAAMFLHAGFLHIGGNMLFLWIFGNNVEDSMGPVKFLVFYIGGGLAALALQIAVGSNSKVPTLGASGAIAAVLGGYIVLYPRARVLTLVFIIFLVTVVELPALVMLGAWFALQAVFGAANLTNPTGGGGGVAYFAHIGGFVFGLLVIRLLATRRKEIPPRLPVY